MLRFNRYTLAGHSMSSHLDYKVTPNKPGSKVRRRLCFSSDEDQKVEDKLQDSNSSGHSSCDTRDFLEDVGFPAHPTTTTTSNTLNLVTETYEPASKKLCLLLNSPQPLHPTEWNTREGKLLSKVMPYDKHYLVRKLDGLKAIIKSSANNDILAYATKEYDQLKRILVQSLVALANSIYRDHDVTPLDRRKFDAIKAILSVWGYVRRGHSSRSSLPLQELSMLSDGTIIQIPCNSSNDSGYEEKSTLETPRKSSQVYLSEAYSITSPDRRKQYTTGGEDKSSHQAYPGTPYPRDSRDLRTFNERTPEHNPAQVSPPAYRTAKKYRSALKPDESKRSAPRLSLTFDESTSAFTKFRASSHSDESFCNCNFCLQNSTTVADVTDDDRGSDRSGDSDKLPVQNLLSVFRSSDGPDGTDTSTNTSSSVSFNYQDDMLTSSPVVPGNADENCLSEVTSLLLQTTRTPVEMGVKREGLSDSLAVLGTNSHVKMSNRKDFAD